MVVAHSFARDEEANGSETVRHDDDKQRRCLILSTGAAAAAVVGQGRLGAGGGMKVVVFEEAAIGVWAQFGVLDEQAATAFKYSITSHRRGTYHPSDATGTVRGGWFINSICTPRVHMSLQ